jgi:hypothetical protein
VNNSILLSQTVEKWFSDEVKAIRLKNNGNEMFNKRRFHDAVELYSQAILHGEFTQSDLEICMLHNRLSWRFYNGAAALSIHNHKGVLGHEWKRVGANISAHYSIYCVSQRFILKLMLICMHVLSTECVN